LSKEDLREFVSDLPEDFGTLSWRVRSKWNLFRIWLSVQKWNNLQMGAFLSWCLWGWADWTFGILGLEFYCRLRTVPSSDPSTAERDISRIALLFKARGLSLRIPVKDAGVKGVCWIDWNGRLDEKLLVPLPYLPEI
jgi:hypothetical protein